MKKHSSFIEYIVSAIITCLKVALVLISGFSILHSASTLHELNGLEESNRAMVGELGMRQQEIVDCSQILMVEQHSKTLRFSNPDYWGDNEWNTTTTLLNQVNNLTTDYKESSK